MLESCIVCKMLCTEKDMCSKTQPARNSILTMLKLKKCWPNTTSQYYKNQIQLIAICFVFPHIKMALSGQRLQGMEEREQSRMKHLQMISEIDYYRCFRNGKNAGDTVQLKEGIYSMPLLATPFFLGSITFTGTGQKFLKIKIQKTILAIQE